MQVFNQQSGGSDCIACCPVEIQCDCSLLECVHLFTTFALNKNKLVYTDRLSQEVANSLIWLNGFALLGTIERPVDSNGNPNVNFGRSLLSAFITNWAWDEGDLRTIVQEHYRILEQLWGDFKTDCGCDEGNLANVDCQALDCVMTTLEEFIQIGLTNRPPRSLEEFAYGGLCGVCYQDCDGSDYIFEK